MAEVPPRLVLSEDQFAELRAHFRQVAPNEAVGLIGGHPDGTAVRITPLANLAGLFAFFADPYQQYLAEKEFRRQGLQVIATYHSHPGGGTGLSEDDHVMVLARRQMLHVIAAVSWTGDEVTGVAVYRVRDGKLATSHLEVAHSS